LDGSRPRANQALGLDHSNRSVRLLVHSVADAYASPHAMTVAVRDPTPSDVATSRVRPTISCIIRAISVTIARPISIVAAVVGKGCCSDQKAGSEADAKST